MIKTNSEYQSALAQLEHEKSVIARQIEVMEEKGLTPDQIDRAIQPTRCLQEQLKEEIEGYEKNRRGDFDPISNLTHIGHLLIGLRISLNLSQTDLATRLRISQAAVSKDERNEYHGVTVERAQRILDAMGVRITVTLESRCSKC